MSNTTTSKAGAVASALNTGEVKYRYIKRKHRGAENPRNPVYDGMLDSAYKGLPVLRDNNGFYKLPLSAEESEFIIEGLGLDKSALSTGKLQNEYLASINIRLPKTGLTLNLTNPYDYLRDVILRQYDNLIAPNQIAADKKYRASYRFVRTTSGEVFNKRKAEREAARKLDKQLEKLEANRNLMMMVILLSGGRVSSAVDKDTLIDMVHNFAKGRPADFDSIVSDPLLQTKGLIELASSLGVVEKRDKRYYYEHKALCFTNEQPRLSEAANYLSDKANSELLVKISKETEAQYKS